MGLIADTFKALTLPRTVAVGATIPTWQDNVPQAQREPYFRYATDGYGKNELVFACVEALATSAAEPRMIGYRKAAGGKPKQVEAHPMLDLLERPNPFLSRFGFWAGVMMYRAVAGNAYIEKVRSRAGQIVELWLLRPDRVRVIPDRQRYVGAYEYRLGDQVDIIPAQDVIHIRTRNPMDDFYGLPPLAVAAGRVDTDNAMRQFTSAFFQNAGVPAGLLTITKLMDRQEREMIQSGFRGDYGGRNAHRLLVLSRTKDANGDFSAEYTPMGLPLGERGLVMPELDAIDEARIAACFAVPLSIVGAKLGMASSSYANRKADQEFFWDNTLAPIYRELAAALTTGLVPEFDGLDYAEFDFSDVRALQEDEDAKHDRIRKDLQAGIITREEARVELGHDREPKSTDSWAIPASLMVEPVTPEPAQESSRPAGPPPNGAVDPRALVGMNGSGRG